MKIKIYLNNLTVAFILRNCYGYIMQLLQLNLHYAIVTVTLDKLLQLS